MWIVVIVVIWAMAIFLLLAFLRGAALANECYDDGHEAAALRVINAHPALGKRAA
jgi:hypothetical protein